MSIKETFTAGKTQFLVTALAITSAFAFAASTATGYLIAQELNRTYQERVDQRAWKTYLDTVAPDRFAYNEYLACMIWHTPHWPSLLWEWDNDNRVSWTGMNDADRANEQTCYSVRQEILDRLPPRPAPPELDGPAKVALPQSKTGK